ncbi:hypothetical protein KKD52_16925 [Myxococcota bacterium]|nr:hypothetical protein [Myxococcota bacterium]
MSPHRSHLAVALFIWIGALGALPAHARDEPPVARGPVASLGLESGVGWMPAQGLFPALPAAHDFTTLCAGLRVRLPGTVADYVVRLSVMDVRLKNGNYLGRGHDWNDVQFVWFDPVRLYYLQVNRERVFARTGPWTWRWSLGLGLGVLSGTMVMQNAQGCRSSNWRTADTDPAWGGCYHDPDPYGSTIVDFPPLMGFLHGAIGASRRYGSATFIAEAGLFLPGFFGVSVAVEWDFPR